MLHRATLADCALMSAIHHAAFTETEAWSRDVFSLQLALPNVSGILYSCSGLVLLRVAADEAEILTLAVEPGARRRGIGAALVREAVASAAAVGASVLFLEVSVANSGALRLYMQSGFVQAGRRAHYYADNSDALVLRLDLR